jgi:hypothetical protein
MAFPHQAGSLIQGGIRRNKNDIAADDVSQAKFGNGFHERANGTVSVPVSKSELKISVGMIFWKLGKCFMVSSGHLNSAESSDVLSALAVLDRYG